MLTVQRQGWPCSAQPLLWGNQDSVASGVGIQICREGLTVPKSAEGISEIWVALSWQVGPLGREAAMVGQRELRSSAWRTDSRKLGCRIKRLLLRGNF